MRAGLGVDAFVGKSKALDGAAGDQVFSDDFGGVFGLHMTIPDCLRINDDRGAMLTLIQAKRLIDADTRAQIGGLGELLQLGE